MKITKGVLTIRDSVSGNMFQEREIARDIPWDDVISLIKDFEEERTAGGKSQSIIILRLHVEG